MVDGIIDLNFLQLTAYSTVFTVMHFFYVSYSIPYKNGVRVEDHQVLVPRPTVPERGGGGKTHDVFLVDDHNSTVVPNNTIVLDARCSMF